MTAELPDIPEAAVEAAARASWSAIVKTPWPAEHYNRAQSFMADARRALTAALPILIEQGWKPPAEAPS